MTMKHEIDSSVTDEDFETSVGRKPRSKDEFEHWTAFATAQGNLKQLWKHVLHVSRCGDCRFARPLFDRCVEESQVNGTVRTRDGALAQPCQQRIT